MDARCGKGYPPLTTVLLRAGTYKSSYICETVDALLAAGADPNARHLSPDPSQHAGPLYYALRAGEGRACDALLAAGALAPSPSTEAMMAMMLAVPEHMVIGGRCNPWEEEDLVAMRLGVLRRVRITDGWYLTVLLRHAAARRMQGAMWALLEAGADATDTFADGRTALRVLLHATGEEGGGLVVGAGLLDDGGKSGARRRPALLGRHSRQVPGPGVPAGARAGGGAAPPGRLVLETGREGAGGDSRDAARAAPPAAGGEGLEEIRFNILGAAFDV